MEVWKVVRKDRTSCIISGAMVLTYDKGKKIVPVLVDYPIFAFKTKGIAERWIEGCSESDDYRIIKCEAEKKSNTHTFVFILGMFDKPALSVKAYELIVRSQPDRNKWAIPRGTVFCKWVKPLE